MPPDLRVVLGAATPPGRLHRAVEGAVGRAAEHGIEADLFDLGAHRIGFADGRDPADTGDDTAIAIAAVESADALVVATPTYRGSMTAVLKNLFDLTPVPALQGKPVGLVVMGGSDHHYLGAERHLRDVLAFFGALAMPVPVYLKPTDFAGGVPGERAEAALDELLLATAEVATALEGSAVARAPAPLAAAMVRG